MAKETTVKEVKQETKAPKAKTKVDVGTFVQRKLQVLNQKNGGRYERDAARVVRNNM